jgi:hypothetical protein
VLAGVEFESPSVEMDELDREIGSAVEREGIPDISEVKLRTGNTKRIEIAMRMIPLRRGAVF